MHGNLDSHPDLPGILADIDRAAKAYERKQKIGATMILAGTTLTAAGTIFLKVEKMKLKLTR